MFEFDIEHSSMDVRRVIGFAMQEVGLDDLSSGMDFLVMQGLLYKLGRREAQIRAKELLELVGLTDVANRKVGTYSGGMRRRIDLAGALVHRPQILFLDEPTAGLDPIGAAEFDDLILDLQRSLGLTVVMITHDLDSLFAITDRISVLIHKRLVTGTIPELLALHDPWINEYFNGPRARALETAKKDTATGDSHHGD